MNDQNNIPIELHDKYTQFQYLSEGSFGIVYKAIVKTTNEKVAIKLINFTNVPQQIIRYFIQEIQILQQLSKYKNPNIIKLLEARQLEKCIVIVMELCTMDLQTLKTQLNQNLPQNIVLYIAKKIINGFVQLHQDQIIYRDLKLENILVNISSQDLDSIQKNRNIQLLTKAEFKLADFGISKVLKSLNSITDSCVGSPETMGMFNFHIFLFLAPEVHEELEYGIEVDMYSLGCVLFQLLTSKLPYEIIRSTIPQPDFFKTEINFGNVRVTEDFKTIIKQMLLYNPKERLQWKDLYDNQFFKDIRNTTKIYQKIKIVARKPLIRINMVEQNDQTTEKQNENNKQKRQIRIPDNDIQQANQEILLQKSLNKVTGNAIKNQETSKMNQSNSNFPTNDSQNSIVLYQYKIQNNQQNLRKEERIKIDLPITQVQQVNSKNQISQQQGRKNYQISVPAGQQNKQNLRQDPIIEKGSQRTEQCQPQTLTQNVQNENLKQQLKDQVDGNINNSQKQPITNLQKQKQHHQVDKIQTTNQINQFQILNPKKSSSVDNKIQIISKDKIQQKNDLAKQQKLQEQQKEIKKVYLQVAQPKQEDSFNLIPNDSQKQDIGNFQNQSQANFPEQTEEKGNNPKYRSSSANPKIKFLSIPRPKDSNNSNQQNSNSNNQQFKKIQMPSNDELDKKEFQAKQQQQLPHPSTVCSNFENYLQKSQMLQNPPNINTITNQIKQEAKIRSNSANQKIQIIQSRQPQIQNSNQKSPISVPKQSNSKIHQINNLNQKGEINSRDSNLTQTVDEQQQQKQNSFKQASYPIQKMNGSSLKQKTNEENITN